jgi:hypothetical protein
MHRGKGTGMLRLGEGHDAHTHLTPDECPPAAPLSGRNDPLVLRVKRYLNKLPFRLSMGDGVALNGAVMLALDSPQFKSTQVAAEEAPGMKVYLAQNDPGHYKMMRKRRAAHANVAVLHHGDYSTLTVMTGPRTVAFDCADYMCTWEKVRNTFVERVKTGIYADGAIVRITVHGGRGKGDHAHDNPMKMILTFAKECVGSGYAVTLLPTNQWHHTAKSLSAFLDIPETYVKDYYLTYNRMVNVLFKVNIVFNPVPANILRVPSLHDFVEGSRVRKRFGDCWFHGRVQEIVEPVAKRAAPCGAAEELLVHVRYDDGDREDYSLEDLAAGALEKIETRGADLARGHGHIASVGRKRCAPNDAGVEPTTPPCGRPGLPRVRAAPLGRPTSLPTAVTAGRRHLGGEAAALLDVHELRTQFRSLFGVSTPSNNRDWLVSRIAGVGRSKAVELNRGVKRRRLGSGHCIVVSAQ